MARRISGGACFCTMYGYYGRGLEGMIYGAQVFPLGIIGAWIGHLESVEYGGGIGRSFEQGIVMTYTTSMIATHNINLQPSQAPFFSGVVT